MIADLKCANCGHSYKNHGTATSVACAVLHGAPLAGCTCQGFKFPETSETPKLPARRTRIFDPKCLNCGHLWSVHFVNDPDPRCSLKITAGKETWCGCAGFRGGCAKCNHSMDEHGALGLGMCQNGGGAPGGRSRCKCDGYEPMRRELPAPITEGIR